MALSPPSLTRSPLSCSDTYCSSSRSSQGDPSPPPEQQYSLTAVYGNQHCCSMTPPMESEATLPSLESLCPSEWDGEAAASSLTASMPSTEYNPYDNFGSSISQPYGHDLYSRHPHLSHGTNTSPPIAHSPLPALRSDPATPSITPRIKVECTEDYDQGLNPEQYASLPCINAEFVADNGYSSTGSGYYSDGQSSWQTPDYQLHLEPAAYCNQTGAASLSTFKHNTQNKDVRPRRAPRRLTRPEEANFRCEVKGCNKLFSRSYNYKAHMETHDEKRQYPFPCTVADCTKKFVRKTDLQRHHQSVHLKERSHKCDYCGRLFARKDTLRRHMDDGCSKRFDIGTLDLRGKPYNSPRSMSSQMNFVVLSGLPPMTMPPLGSNNVVASNPLIHQTQEHWGP
ncbi:hypothetical protein DL546_001479 [Coniochaeta pulveracea]|uniref:C2H2-type domain-containing protein n=1 Tax=Coniochaeta pulveracea TaxID=177199 RepID=A0A420Y4V3_9PEZI|nr:hypothetical protein DL546_001479 [Coniochaeta pulveracea]